MSERRYGEWAGNPNGVAEDNTRCAEKIWPRDEWWITAQCSRKRGYGKDGLYCVQHAKRHPAGDVTK